MFIACCHGPSRLEDSPWPDQRLSLHSRCVSCPCALRPWAEACLCCGTLRMARSCTLNSPGCLWCNLCRLFAHNFCRLRRGRYSIVSLLFTTPNTKQNAHCQQESGFPKSGKICFILGSSPSSVPANRAVRIFWVTPYLSDLLCNDGRMKNRIRSESTAAAIMFFLPLRRTLTCE